MQTPTPTLTDLITWLEQQDPERAYRYSSTKECLICQFFSAMALPVLSMGSHSWFDQYGREHPLDPVLNDVAYADPHTFGAALDRARAA